MLIVLMVLLAAALCLTIVPQVRMSRDKRQCWSDSECAECAVIWVVFGILTILFTISYFVSVSRYAQIEEFEKLQEYYEAAAVDTLDASVTVKLDTIDLASILSIGGSVEHLVNGKVATKRILEARDFALVVTKARVWYRNAQHNWFIKLWIAKPPPGLFDDKVEVGK